MGAKEDPKLGKWGGTCDFLVTSLGFAVGLGNIWRFPAQVFKSGGGAFLIPYAICLLLVAVPLIIMESSIGQFASQGPVGIWKLAPIGQGIGMGVVCLSFILSIYYNAPIAWAANYFVLSMRDPLPWSSCDPKWADEWCSDNFTEVALLNNSNKYETSAEQFYYNKVLGISDGLTTWGSMQWELVVANAIMWVLVFLVISKGAESLGKVAYFTSLFPYVLLSGMLVYTCLLEGAINGIEFYITPVWSKLGEFDVWQAALVQAFFSTGVSEGGVITLASYNRFNHNIVRDCIIIPLLDGLTSIFAGFCVFSVLGAMAHKKGLPPTREGIESVVEEGPGLIFVTYPETFSYLADDIGSVGAIILSCLFFFTICILGLSSQFPPMETVCKVMSDAFPQLRAGWKSYLLRATVCFTAFCFGLPFFWQSGFYLYNLIDARVVDYPIMMLALIECFMIGWVYGGGRLRSDIAMMIGDRFWASYWWDFCWRVLSPAIILVILIVNLTEYGPMSIHGYDYPDWTEAITWTLIMMPLSIAIVFAIYKFIRAGGCSHPIEALKETSSPAPDWGPAEPENWVDAYAHLHVVKMIDRELQEGRPLSYTAALRGEGERSSYPQVSVVDFYDNDAYRDSKHKAYINDDSLESSF